MKTLFIYLSLCSCCLAGTKTYYNRSGQVHFRSTQVGNRTVTTDRRGCFSGSYIERGNSVTRTQTGFRQCVPGSTFTK